MNTHTLTTMPKDNFIKTVLIIVMFFSFLSFSQEKKKIAIYFEFDKYEITPKGKITLDSILNLISNSRGYNITINAYTDSKGTSQHNFGLANYRKKAVFDYFIENKLDVRRVSYSKFNENLENISDDLRRKAIIELEYIKSKTFYGKNGTQVIAGKNDGVTINEYFSAKEMIRDSKFAIDEKDQIIRSDGMITICYGRATLDETGNFYLVKMPSREGVVNPSMDVYLEVTNDKDEKRWKLTEIKAESDETKKFYIFKIPIVSNGCISLNVDCKLLPDNEKITYVSTMDIFDNVEVRDAKNKLLFSAYRDNGGRENQYVFLTKTSIITRSMFFYGYKKNKKTMLRLSDLNLKEVEKKGNIPAKEYYSETVYNAKDYENGKTEKKGFWPLIKKVFTGKKTYITNNNNKQQTT